MTECSFIKWVILEERSWRYSSDTALPHLLEDFCSSALLIFLRFIFDNKGEASSFKPHSSSSSSVPDLIGSDDRIRLLKTIGYFSSSLRASDREKDDWSKFYGPFRICERSKRLRSRKYTDGSRLRGGWKCGAGVHDRLKANNGTAFQAGSTCTSNGCRICSWVGFPYLCVAV